jgi:hypothetical protein
MCRGLMTLVVDFGAGDGLDLERGGGGRDVVKAVNFPSFSVLYY